LRESIKGILELALQVTKVVFVGRQVTHQNLEVILFLKLIFDNGVGKYHPLITVGWLDFIDVDNGISVILLIMI